MLSSTIAAIAVLAATGAPTGISTGARTGADANPDTSADNNAGSDNGRDTDTNARTNAKTNTGTGTGADADADADAATGADVSVANNAAGKATLPLAQLLELYEERRSARLPPDRRAPVAAGLQSVEGEARLLEAGVELAMTFSVAVIESGVWSRVPLLALDAETHVTRLPACDGCTVVRDRGELVFLGNHAGAYALEVRVYKPARRAGQTRHVTIGVSPAASALLHVRFDEGVFTLRSPGALPEAEGAVLFARDGAFALRWELQGVAAERTAARRAPVDPVIETAHVSVVSTLEGKRLVRLLYELRLSGEQRLSVALPAHATLTKALVNQGPVSVAAPGGHLELTVGPARAGDESGRVELVYEEPQAGYLLSGSLAYALPAPSWRTNELWVALHLPEVFNYTWSGGSLAPAEDAPAADFAQALPTPGKVVVARQLLVTGAAHLRLAYAVALDGHYFR